MQEIPLIKALQNGDETAFKALVIMYRPMVHRVIFRMLQNDDDTEDLVQDVFIQIWQSICNFRGEAGLKTWIYRLAVNKAISHLRWQRIRSFMSVSISSSKINSEDRIQIDNNSGFEKLAQMDSNKAIIMATQKLPANQSAAFMLSKAEGLSNSEIAMVLNTTIGAVESLIFRAKKQLKRSLEKYYDESIS